MYTQQPSIISQTPFPPSPLKAVRPVNTRRIVLTRFVLICTCFICSLVIIAILIALILYFVLRSRNHSSPLLSYPEFTCSQYSCGCPNYNYKIPLVSKIVGGEDAPPNIYPWLVALTNRYSTDPFCAGFIISFNTILTAAHCLIRRNPHQIQILAKAHDIRLFNGYRYDIEKWFIHPEYQYNNSIQLNDIAIIKIKDSFANDLRPCCLPRLQSSIYPLARTSAVASGWGKRVVESSNEYSPILQHVVMPIVSERNDKCRESIVDMNRQLCAGYQNQRIDTCSGDSGSPLLIVEYNGKKRGHFVATGIVSYGNSQCDASLSSGVYTRVGFYLPWIYDILSNL